MYDHYSASLRKGVNSVYFEGGDSPLSHRLQANVSRFAAYKAHHVTGALHDVLNDDTIPVKDREKYAKETLKIFDRWHDTEYNTAVTRSRTAKQFAEFNHPDNLRLFPSLRWVPSRSVKVRVAHTVFYNRVWKKNDPFWQTNTPGTEWGCKCDVEETSDNVTDNAKVPHIKPPAGLEGNPAITGEVFTDKASYIKHNKPFELDSQTASEFKNLQTLISNDTAKWRFDYYTDNEGMLITNRRRIKESELNREEFGKFNKEHSMCQTLAKNGYRVDYRETIDRSFDIYMDGIAADLKKTAGSGNIVKYANKAINKQGAKVVVFEFENETKEIYLRIDKLKELNIKGYYYFSHDRSKVYEF